MAYSWKATLTIDYTKCGTANSTDFPVLVSFTNADFKTVANGGKVQNASGFDIAFYSDAALTTPVFWLIERYIPTTGECIFKCKIATLSASANTLFYVAFGDASIATFQSTSTSVWDSNFKGVWALSDGTTLSATDSTIVASTAAITAATAIAGKIDGGASFNGTSAKINVTPAAGLDFSGAGSISIETWCKAASLPATQILVSKMHTTNDQIAYLLYFTSTGKVGFQTTSGATAHQWQTTATPIAVGNYYHIVLTYTWDATTGGASIKCYIDSTSTAGTWTIGTGNVTFTNNNKNIFFAQLDYAGLPLPLNGELDEIRISNTTRSQSWVTASYNNQNVPSTFMTMGTVTAIVNNQSQFFAFF